MANARLSSKTIIFIGILVVIILALLLKTCNSKNEITLEWDQNSKIETASIPILMKRLNALSRDLGIKFTYKSIFVEGPIIRTSRSKNNVSITVSETISKPAYNINKGYIEMPYNLYQDPVVLVHELYHYLTHSGHHNLSGLNSEFLGCMVKERSCLNLTDTHMSSAKPLNFLLLSHQVNLMNNQKTPLSTVPCEDQATRSSFHVYPKRLIQKNIESYIDCCDNAPISSQEMQDILNTYYTPQPPDVIQSTLTYSNNIIQSLTNNEICLLSIDQVSPESFSQALRSFVYPSYNARVDSVDSQIIQEFDEDLRLARVISHYKEDKRLNSNEILNLRKEYFSDIFKEDNIDSFLTIRNQTFTHYQRMKLKKWGFSPKFILQFKNN